MVSFASIVEDPSFTYNSTQTALACAQQIFPSTAFTIFKMQNITLISDLSIAAFSAATMYHKAQEKYQDFYAKHSWVFNGIAILAGISLIAVSFQAVRYLNRLFTPQINLTEVLKNSASFSIDHIKNIDMSWDRPVLQEASQFFLVARIILNLTGSFLTKKHSFYLRDAALQAVSLFQISKLNWVCFKRSWENPLQEFAFELQQSNENKIDYSKTVQKLEAKFFILFSSSSLSDKNSSIQLQSIIKSIYEYSSQAFKNSIWYRYWNITKTRGIETSRSLIYKIVCKRLPLPSISSGQPLLLTDVDVSIYDSIRNPRTGQIGGWRSAEISFYPKKWSDFFNFL